MRGFGAAEGVGAPTAAALLPALGPGPLEHPALIVVTPGAEVEGQWGRCGGSVRAEGLWGYWGMWEDMGL